MNSLEIILRTLHCLTLYWRSYIHAVCNVAASNNPKYNCRRSGSQAGERSQDNPLPDSLLLGLRQSA